MGILFYSKTIDQTPYFYSVKIMTINGQILEVDVNWQTNLIQKLQQQEKRRKKH